ncbi:hypothetical protein ACMV_29090 [Acidiphilium multivorum AIU301]|jgi:hypothetical protein|uniref:Uncharacterized protein n=2 Tax=Acidocellaceae TaxID=3385905 RepID=F0J4Q9_ACIMA|nr:hypothetical protein ACMV_29090 [Acidiphilium multivorum AIU301]
MTMTDRSAISRILRSAALLGAFTAGGAASAQAAGPFAALGAGAALSDARLASIRGGFDLTPQLTVDFAYRQVTTVNGTVIAAVAIPQIHLAFGPATAALSLPSIATTTTPSVGATGSAPPTPPAPNTATPSVPTPLPAPTMTSPAALVHSVSNVGGTNVATTFSSSGIATIIANTANNALIQNQIAVDIGTTGMSTLLTGQAHAMMISQAMTDATRNLR